MPLSGVRNDHYYRHVKTGGFYQVLFLGYDSKDKTEVVIYRAHKDDTIWVRPRAEFCDGRFEYIGDLYEMGCRFYGWKLIELAVSETPAK